MERLIFGVHTMADAAKLCSVNRRVDQYGKGPMGATCGDCALVIAGHRRSFKCGLDSRKTRLKWPACSQIEVKKNA